MMSRRRKSLLSGLAGAAIYFAALAGGRAADTGQDGADFFEKKIRPVLTERCFKCHSATSEKLKAGLRLDSRDEMLKGGDSGPAIAPGHPEQSRLVEAIAYGNVDLQMPPKGMLPKDQIADFNSWIQMGAPWPASPSSAVAGPAKPAFNLEERRRSHWCWQPIKKGAPPAVTRQDWPANEVDRFVLAKLEERQLAPAPDASLRTQVRRLYFDLTGLPPSPEEVDQFLEDKSPQAWPKLVDKLLASPQFGERWARHWLDLVRYAETLGHEFDYPIASAWRYRDYVIRAFNEDLPYDRFVQEQVAGDLLPPRFDAGSKVNEAVVATAFYWLGQQTHSPVDARQEQADTVDNQIDVLGKTFLGLTIGCARCHDHKFDAISTRDYYSLYGTIESSRFALRAVDSGAAARGSADKIAAAKLEIRQSVGGTWLAQMPRVEKQLEVLAGYLVQASSPAAASNSPATFTNSISQSLLSACLDEKPGSTNVGAISMAGLEARPGDIVFADAGADTFKSWWRDGMALSGNPVVAGDFAPGDKGNPLVGLAEAGSVHSGLLSRRLEGAIRSPTFVIGKDFIHVRAAGKGARLNVVVDNFTLIRDPIYGGLKRALDREEPAWITVDVARWKGHRVYLEFGDNSTSDPADPGGYPKDGYFAASQVVFSDDRQAPQWRAPAFAPSELTAPGAAKEISRRLAAVAADWAKGRTQAIRADPAAWRVLSNLARRLLIESVPGRENSAELSLRYDKAWAAIAEAETNLPPADSVVAMADGNGMDETVFIRGSPKNPGPLAPRKFLEAIGGPNQACFSQGSGRLELAQRLVEPSNPLTARVMANRVWGYLFGQGIVPSPDNFGALGQAPSHPELLDWLATWYRDHDWSTKGLVRLLVTSRTYRMSARPADEAVEAADPGDRWLHRMRARRLEGEAIRDAILKVAGDLDEKQYGPPVPVFLTPFMDGRGRPGKSGPLDGEGRRSIYLETRRNFLNPFMMAFDAPAPFTTVGRRTDSNLPAQALILLNDPFVIGQAKAWTKRLAASSEEGPGRVRRMYLEAFGRPPDDKEQSAALDFLRTQGEALGASQAGEPRDERVWADFAHVLLNVSEFVYVE